MDTEDTMEPEAAPSEARGDNLPVLTGTAFADLAASGPWMRLIGIVTFAACGVMLIAGLVMIFNMERLPGLIYIVLAVVCFFPARFLFRAGSKLCALKAGGGGDALEDALRNNRSYWKFSGVITVVSLGLTVLVIVVVLIGTLIERLG
ncbi:MAG: hypothetical protein LBO04_04620 [Spirochaetaceae bacterium]|nr:hypothetical protein [Spirochaetaceae bacterium]